MTLPSLAERGRRAGTAALLVVVSAGVAQAILANPEPPPAAQSGPAPTTTAAMAVPTGAASSPTITATTSKTAPATAAKPADPRAVAVAWYARRHRIDPSKVTALQADKLTGATYRVLLMVTKPGGGLDSAVVTVTRTNGGAWRVESTRG
jgi:hypothetical protein